MDYMHTGLTVHNFQCVPTNYDRDCREGVGFVTQVYLQQFAGLEKGWACDTGLSLAAPSVCRARKGGGFVTQLHLQQYLQFSGLGKAGLCDTGLSLAALSVCRYRKGLCDVSQVHLQQHL